MSISVVWDGVTYVVPESGEKKWGAQVTAELRDLLKAASGGTAIVNGTSLLLAPSVSTILADGAQLVPIARTHRVQGVSGPVTLDAVSALPNGSKDGQLLFIEGAHATNKVTIQDGANVDLRGDITLGLNEAILLRWDSGVGDWIELARGNSQKLFNQAGLDFYEARANGSNRIRIQGPASLSADQTWTLPATQQVGSLRNDGAGVLTWDPITSIWENVVSAGADPTGNTNSSAAIQTTIDTVVTAGGGVIFFPKGIYRLESTLSIPISARGLTILGYGATVDGFVNGPLLRISDTTTPNNRVEKIAICGLILNGRGASDGTYTAQNGIELYACMDVVFRDVTITNMPQYGFLGLKSAASGSAYWNMVQMDQVKIRFCGKEGLLACKTGAAGDDIVIVGSMFNNLGMRLTTEPGGGDAGVYIRVATLGWYGGEVSAVRNQNGTNGFIRAMIVRAANGIVSGVHFEDNCNNQASSYDLLLDTDANGLAVIGTNHSCNTATSSRDGIRVTSRDNVIAAIRMDGGATHVLNNIVDLGGATNPTVFGVSDGGGTAPSNKYVTWTAGTEQTNGAIQGVLEAFDVLLPNNKYLRARESGGTNRVILGIDAANSLTLGDASGKLVVKTGSSEAFHIDSSQRVIVGQTGAGSGSRLHVEQSGSGIALNVIQNSNFNGLSITLSNSSNGISISQSGSGGTGISISKGAGSGNGITVSNLGTGTGIELDDISSGSATFLSAQQSTNLQALVIKQNTTSLTLAGQASPVSAANLIPSGSFVIGVTARVTTAATGTGLTSLDVGDSATSANHFTAGATLGISAGSICDLTNYADITAPLIYRANASVAIRGNGLSGNFTAGVVRLTVHYISLIAPSS